MLSELLSLNKLELTEDELKALADYEKTSFAQFDMLKNLDITNVEPMIYNYNMVNVFREDVEIKKFSREQVLSNAPEQYEGAFQVPRVVE